MHRNETLAAVGVSFHEVQRVGQGTGLGVENADARAPLREIEARAVVVAAAHPGVDEPVRRARNLQHVAERGEGRGRQGPGQDRAAHGSMSFRRRRAMRST